MGRGTRVKTIKYRHFALCFATFLLHFWVTRHGLTDSAKQCSPPCWLPFHAVTMSAPTSVDESKGDGGASAVVRTVRGDIDPATIGVTLMHEHLIVDYARNFAPPKAGTSRSTLGGLTPEQHLEMWEAPMSTQVAGHCRCYFSANRDNMILEDVDTIAAEVRTAVAVLGGFWMRAASVPRCVHVERLMSHG